MSTYTQYSTSDITDSAGDTWTYTGISEDAARYTRTSGSNIAFEIDTNAPGPIHVWRDDGENYPATFSHSATGPWTSSVGDAQTIYMNNPSATNVRSFTSPHWQYSSANPANSGGGGALPGGPGQGPGAVPGRGKLIFWE